MRLFIIRHAESSNNRLADTLEYEAYLAHRVDDPPLSELGERQAILLAGHLAANAHPESRDDEHPVQPFSGYGFTRLYCSPMLRSMQTAEPIARTTGLRPEIWVDIHETGGIFLGNPHSGDLAASRPGMTRSQMLARFPHYFVPESIPEDGWWNRGYEDKTASSARAADLAKSLRRRAAERCASGAGEAIAMVSHGGFIDRLLKALLEHNPESQLFYQHYNTAITRIDFMEDGTLLVRYLNRTQHLPPEMFSI